MVRDMIHVVIPGDPKGKGRHRTTRTGINYTPAATASYENWVKLCYQDQAKGIYLGDIPLKARIDCFCTIPKSDSKKKKKEKADGIIRPTKKPDVDNITKIILDALNKLAYDDDKQIVELEVNKYYAEIARVELLLSEVVE